MTVLQILDKIQYYYCWTELNKTDMKLDTCKSSWETQFKTDLVLIFSYLKCFIKENALLQIKGREEIWLPFSWEKG